MFNLLGVKQIVEMFPMQNIWRYPNITAGGIYIGLKPNGIYFANIDTDIGQCFGRGYLYCP